MTVGLPVSRLIALAYTISGSGALFPNLATALVLGNTNVIDTAQRYRSYASPGAVAADFGTSAPEYLAAVDFFAQNPTPTQLFIGRWAQAATAGILKGGALSPAQQALSVFTALTSSGFKIQVDAAGSPVAVSVGTLAGITSLNGVATAINTGLASASVGATCAWNASQNQFVFTSNTTGTTSKVQPLTAPASGTNLATYILGTTALGAIEVDGIAAETALAAFNVLDALPFYFYGLMVASPQVVDADHIAISAAIQGDTLGPHVYAVTTQNANCLVSGNSSDIGSVLQAAGASRSFVVYSSTDPYAAASVLGRMVSINWLGSKTAINFMYQPMPGIVAETITSAQANTIDTKRINYSANYANGVAVFESGIMSASNYIDEIVGADWLSGYIQTNVFNLLSTIGTKVAQTDEGMHLICNNIEASLDQGVINGLLAPGTWTTAGFGALNLGAYLSKGYYVYQPPIAGQSSGVRATRVSVAFQIAAKFAGAVDTANLSMTINR